MKRRQRSLGLGIVGLSAVVVAGVSTGVGGIGTASAAPGPHAGSSERTVAGGGAAFAMTNATAGNQIVSYQRAANGSLRRVGSTSTRGLGIGVDLDSQGPLRLSRDHQYLYAVNAGSDSITVFRVKGTKLKVQQTIYAGDQPVSLTVRDHTVYVLDGSVASNSIRGFTRGSDGNLAPIKGSVQPLSSPIAVPGDIEFSPDGRTILVTQKTTAVTLTPSIAIDSFAIDADGVAGPAKRNASVGVRPFALAFRNDNQALVVESFDASAGRSAVSSYDVRNQALTPISSSVGNLQTDTCWIVITKNGRYAYTANFGSGTISSYRIAEDGTVTLQQGKAADLGGTSQPVDLVQSQNGAYLYQLLRGTGAVAQFAIGDNGALRPLGVAHGGLPVADGASGLAVY